MSEELQLAEETPKQVILTESYTDEMIFDSVEPVEIKVTIKGEKYILREADEAAVVAYRNCQVRAARVVDGKFTGMGDIVNSEPLLLSKCLLYEKDRKNVPLEVINKWRHKVTKPLLERLKKISEIDTGDTIEGLEKRLAEDQKKLAKLIAERDAKDPKAKETAAKKEHSDSQDGSD